MTAMAKDMASSDRLLELYWRELKDNQPLDRDMSTGGFQPRTRERVRQRRNGALQRLRLEFGDRQVDLSLNGRRLPRGSRC
ncbi:MAG: hypothetical protein ABIL09_12875 [Gemmatimonadota bacterium]